MRFRFLRFFLLIIATLTFFPLLAQNFGGNPNRIKYRQIDNDTVRVIFPEGMDYWGQRVANLALFQASILDSSLISPPIKTSIIIRNLSTLSNGFVAYGPYRSEYFSTPPLSQFSGPAPWVDLLHIHEYRHILQESKVMIDRKWAPERILLGQYGWSVVNVALLPNWYYEGDAVKTETLYSFSGRGRLPRFYMEIPALRQNGKRYNFEKMRAGSYKDAVPNHYSLGYHMTSYMEILKGKSAWNEITNRSIKKYALISRSAKKLYGLNNRALYDSTMHYLDSFYTEADTSSDQVERAYDPNNFTSYELTKMLPDGSLIYLKSDLRSIPAFYRYDGRKESKIYEPSMIHSEHWFDIKDNLLLWTEFVPDLLWQNEDFSSLKILDISSGKAHYLGPLKRKYFYPKWAEESSNIGLIELAETTQQSILLLDKNGNELKRFVLEEGNFVSAIIKVKGNDFWLVRNIDEQAEVISLNIESGEMQSMGAPLNAIIRHPVYDDHYIYFSTNAGIEEQIIRLDISTKEYEVLTNAPFRAMDPLIKNDSLYYISYEGAGYAIRKKENRSVGHFEVQDPEIAFYSPLEKKGTGSILKAVPKKKYLTKKFKKSKEFLQFHSWIPYVIPPNFGVTLLTANKIGTFEGELSYVYNINEGASQFSGRVNYAQIYPKLFAGASYTLNRKANESYFPFDQLDPSFNGRDWSETDFFTGAILPFYLSRGKWSRYLSFEGSAHYLMANYSEYLDQLPNIDFPYVNARLYFYNLKRQALRQINPRWGQFLVFDQSQSIDPNIGSQFYFLSSFYFPGIFKTHSLTISPYYKYEPQDLQYDFLDAFPSSYGYTRYAALNSYRILVKYSMPLCYPDIGIPGLAFLQRIYASAFYDESYFTSPGYLDAIQRSFGIEINLNMVLLRILPFEIGVRGMYRIDPYTKGDSPYYVELLFYGFSF